IKRKKYIRPKYGAVALKDNIISCPQNSKELNMENTIIKSKRRNGISYLDFLFILKRLGIK
ncbi:hypothetical protein ACHM6O_005826, partial [Klebsiella pneumoniae]